MTTTLDLADLRSHIGRSQTATDVIHAGPANSLRLALGRPEPEFRDGDVLPPAWLGLYFLPRVASDALRPDGSPRDTGVIPPLALPRRMFSGERVRFHAAVRVGESLRRETRLADISVKHGGTGTLVFATITSRVYGPNGLALRGRAPNGVPRRGEDGRAQSGAAARVSAERRAVAAERDRRSGSALPLLGADLQ